MLPLPIKWSWGRRERGRKEGNIGKNVQRAIEVKNKQGKKTGVRKNCGQNLQRVSVRLALPSGSASLSFMLLFCSQTLQLNLAFSTLGSGHTFIPTQSMERLLEKTVYKHVGRCVGGQQLHEMKKDNQDNTHWGDCNCRLSYIVAEPKLLLPLPCLHGKFREVTEAAISGSHGDSGCGIYSNLWRFGAVCWRQVFWPALHFVCESLHLIVIIMLPGPYIVNSFEMCFHFQRNVHIQQLNQVWLDTCAHICREMREHFSFFGVFAYIYYYAPLILLCTVMSIFPLHPFQGSLDQFLFLLDSKLVISRP